MATGFPRRFGKYVLLGPFARGGMGEIFLAASGEIGGAEKLCLVKKVCDDRDSLSARLLEEAKIAVRLNHSNLVQVFDAGRVDGQLYIAMELIEGRDLRAISARSTKLGSRVPLDVALYTVREILRGLEYAHGYGGLGLVHRDIAPPNILLSWHGAVKVTDFGLVRSSLSAEPTAPGWRCGRLAYMAPEQAQGKPADVRCDLYSTGVILWELLTGRALHLATATLDAVRDPNVALPSDIVRSLPPRLDAVVMRALAKDRDARFRSAGEFRIALSEELTQLAPGSDDARVAGFLRHLYSKEIEHESAERERILRDGLRELRTPSGSYLKPEAQETPPPEALTPEVPALEMETPEIIVDVQATPPLESAPAFSSSDVETTELTPPPVPIDALKLGAVPSRSSETGFGQSGTARANDTTQPVNWVGRVFDGRYRIERMIGTGGMGAVYEAEHVEIGKRMALKVLHPQYSRQADLVARFRREARAASKVGHPNIVDVTDFGTTDSGDVYFVMERLEGIDLGELLSHEGKLAPDRAVHIVAQICRALAAAHTAGIIHRDLKPENIYLCTREGTADFVKVLDFGIAKQDMGNQNSARRLTTPGVAMGTPEYMAPEQAAGRPIDGRVDIYSVGVILYELLSGELPHVGNNMMEVLTRKATEAPRHLRKLNPAISEELEQVVVACLNRNPQMRPQTMSAVEYELNKAMKGRGSAVAAVLGIREPNRDSNPGNDWPASEEGKRDPSGRHRQISPVAAAPTALAVEGSAPISLRPPQRRAPRVVWPIAAALAVVAPIVVWLELERANQSPYEIQAPAALIRPDPPSSATLARPKPTVTSLRPTPPSSKEANREASRDVERMLEWAQRTVDGNRIVSPPGDNLKDLLEKIRKIDPKNRKADALEERTGEALLKRGMGALKRNHIEEAMREFQTLLSLRPHDQAAKHALVRAFTQRAEWLLSKHQTHPALMEVNTALQLDPNDMTAHVVLAEIYKATGKLDLAAAELERVTDQKPLQRVVPAPKRK